MLASKVALVTGAAQGIGLAATRLLLKNGARVSKLKIKFMTTESHDQVMMLDIDEAVGQSSCSSLQKEFSSSDVMFSMVDVTRSEDLVIEAIV